MGNISFLPIAKLAPLPLDLLICVIAQGAEGRVSVHDPSEALKGPIEALKGAGTVAVTRNQSWGCSVPQWSEQCCGRKPGDDRGIRRTAAR